MGQFPRKCKLRGPSGVTVGSAYINCGSAYISPGPNCENLAKFNQNQAKLWQIWQHLAKKLAKFQRFLKKILSIENGAKECIV